MPDRSDYGAEFGLAPASKVHDGQVKHNDMAVMWFDSAEQAEEALTKYWPKPPEERLVVVRRAWTVVDRRKAAMAAMVGTLSPQQIAQAMQTQRGFGR